MIKVATLYQLAVMAGKYTKEHKSVERTGLVIEESYIEQVNKNYLDTGKLYEIDEVATKKWHEDFAFKQMRLEESAKMKSASNAAMLGEALQEVVVQSIETKKRKSKKE